MKIIFLDIDGVLNCENGYKKGLCKYVGDDEFHYQQFYPPAKKLLNKLIDETNAKIVISSTWRHSGIDFMKKVWESEGMSGEIYDVTPSFINLAIGDLKMGIPRGLEISYWLKDKGFAHINWSKEYQKEYIKKSGIENYIIIDDDSDMLYNQRKHFIHVKPSPRNKDGFNILNYEKAINILNRTMIDLNF